MAESALLKLAATTGLPEVASLLFEGLKTVNVRDEINDFIPIRCNLAATYGKLNPGSIKELDEDLKVYQNILQRVYYIFTMPFNCD